MIFIYKNTKISREITHKAGLFSKVPLIIET